MASLLLDARSPSEFAHAHIPGAVNIPLMDDEQRRIVGTTYKHKGRNAAVLAGFDLVGPKFGDIVRTAQEKFPDKDVLVYCWRGGMRSAIMAWILGLAGFKVSVRKGGYKAYRASVLESFNEPRKVVVIGGKTGSGKTDVLKELSRLGEQVIDLEGLACHKGSSFGALGQPPQPSNEQFENLLSEKWRKADSTRPCWLENESRNIGRIKLPEQVYEAIRTSVVMEVELPTSLRMERIIRDYGSFDRAELIEATLRLTKKLGGQHAQAAVEALEAGNLKSWLEKLFVYYDKTYQHGNSLRDPSSIHVIPWNPKESPEEFALRLLRFSKTVIS
jgi:tRNA 2-selenouridine synthase